MAKARSQEEDKLSRFIPISVSPSREPISSPPTLTALVTSMSFTAGAATATNARGAPPLHIMFPVMSLGIRIWMIMATGVRYQIMALCGSLVHWLRTGLRIDSAIGFGSPLGDGHGSTTHPGVLLRSITVAGLMLVVFGDGGLDQLPSFAPSMHRRWWLGLAVRTLVSVSAALAPHGSRLVPVRFMFLRIVRVDRM